MCCPPSREGVDLAQSRNGEAHLEPREIGAPSNCVAAGIGMTCAAAPDQFSIRRLRIQEVDLLEVSEVDPRVEINRVTLGCCMRALKMSSSATSERFKGSSRIRSPSLSNLRFECRSAVMRRAPRLDRRAERHLASLRFRQRVRCQRLHRLDHEEARGAPQREHVHSRSILHALHNDRALSLARCSTWACVGTLAHSWRYLGACWVRMPAAKTLHRESSERPCPGHTHPCTTHRCTSTLRGASAKPLADRAQRQ